MNMRLPLAAAAATASLAFAASAGAAVTYVGYGVALPTGERLITDFADATGLSGTYELTTGTSGSAAAPAFSASTADTAQYLAILGGDDATLTFTPTKEVSVYIGSLDDYNTISLMFDGTPSMSYTGTDLVAATSGSCVGGDQQTECSNGRFIFNFSSPVKSLEFASTIDSFEIADVGGVVPEPASWAMMLVGLAGLGGAMRSRRHVLAQAA